MTGTVPDILAQIVARKREELADAPISYAALEKQAQSRIAGRRDMMLALRSQEAVRKPAIIGEIKKASPSKGVLASDYQPAKIAAAYQQGGAVALSVLTDRDFFHGGLDDLEAARAAVNLPVLRKDFTIDPLHVVEAAAHGADAILLIATILEVEEMREFRELAAQFKMAAIVEVHNADEVLAAIDSGAEIIGVNTRNLRTFEVRLDNALELEPIIPPDVLKVAESGIHNAADARRLVEAGYSALLVGEYLMSSDDPAEAVRRLCS